MIPSCGIVSLPADLLTFMMAEMIRSDFQASTSAALVSTHDGKTQPSGGSLNGLVTSFSSYGLKKILDAAKPWALSPVQPAEAHDDGIAEGISEHILKQHEFGTLGFGVSSTHDQALVQRSWGLLQQARNNGLEFSTYGPNFNFRSAQRFPSRFHAKALFLLVWTMTIFPAVFPPLRWLVGWLFPTGSGPTEEERKTNFIEYRGIAVADLIQDSSDGSQSSMEHKGVYASMRYDGDPYVLTGIMAAEAAMAILDLKNETLAHRLRGGVLTPAMLGQPLANRLIGAGVRLKLRLIS